MCGQVIAMMSQGKSKTEVGAALGVHPKTFRRWADPQGEYYQPEFAEALSRGMNASLAWKRRASISAGMRRYWKRRRRELGWDDALLNAGRIQGTNYQGASYYRTPEHRARQSAAIRQWRPWEHSTGPKSEEGKARVSRNAYKGRTQAARTRNLCRKLGDSLARDRFGLLRNRRDRQDPHPSRLVLPGHRPDRPRGHSTDSSMA